jgi:hypothetical protein
MRPSVSEGFGRAIRHPRQIVIDGLPVIQEKSKFGFAARTSKADLQGAATTKIVNLVE